MSHAGKVGPQGQAHATKELLVSNPGRLAGMANAPPMVRNQITLPLRVFRYLFNCNGSGIQMGRQGCLCNKEAKTQCGQLLTSCLIVSLHLMTTNLVSQCALIITITQVNILL